jgi:hypothetical protein
MVHKITASHILVDIVPVNHGPSRLLVNLQEVLWNRALQFPLAMRTGSGLGALPRLDQNIAP